MVEVRVTDIPVSDSELSYVVISAIKDGGWLFVRHRTRGGYEMPAGHPEAGEESVTAAVRELMEETGALTFTIEPVCYYSVTVNGLRKYGRLFYAVIESAGEVTDTEEIAGVTIFRRRPSKLSLPEVMTFLHSKAVEYRRKRDRRGADRIDLSKDA